MTHPWICPFCPLHCEDVKIERQPGGARAVIPACSLAQAALDRLDLDRSVPRAAKIDGNVVDWQEAIGYVAERLRQSEAVAMRGLLTGIGSARSALGFAEQFDAAIDHDASQTQIALRRAIAREGLFSATLGDVRRYADLVLLIGHPQEAFPRLAERFFGHGRVAGRTRRIVSLDPDSTASRRDLDSKIPAAAGLERLPVAADRLSEFFAAFRLHARTGEAGQTWGLDERTSDQLRKLTEWVDAANYVAVVLGPFAMDLFGPIGAEVESEALLASVAALNRERRAVLLSLDRSTSFRQVALWRSGFSGPVGWQQGVPAPLDQAQFDTLWASPDTTRLQIECSTGTDFAAPIAASPSQGRERPVVPATVLFAVEGTNAAKADNAHVFLPIAAPGIEIADTVVRGDGTVNLPLTPLRSVREPTLTETLFAISQAVRPATDPTASRTLSGR